MTKSGHQAKNATDKSPWPGPNARKISVPVFCTCNRHPGAFHGLSPGCPGMAAGERLQLVPGDIPGTISYLFDPDNPPPGPNADGTTTLLRWHDEQSQGLSDRQWPEVASAWPFDEYGREIADRPEKLRDRGNVMDKFLRASPSVPGGRRGRRCPLPPAFRAASDSAPSTRGGRRGGCR